MVARLPAGVRRRRGLCGSPDKSSGFVGVRELGSKGVKTIVFGVYFVDGRQETGVQTIVLETWNLWEHW